MKLDDFSIGEVFTTKSLTVTKEDIMKFAEEYDPQYMHLDEEEAKQGMFNGIIASGVHTLAISFKLWIEHGIYGDDIIAGSRINHVRFSQPVYPGDKLHTTAEVIAKKALKKDKGTVTVLLSTFNDKDEKVFQGELTAVIKQ